MERRVTSHSRREELYDLLGDLPARDRSVHATTLSEEDRDGYALERLHLDLNGVEAVPAYFVRPKTVTGRLPTVLYCHSHGGAYGVGKDELVEHRPSFQDPPYAVAFTQRGMAALCFDTWVFGERSGRSESSVFKEMLWRGRVLWGMMVYDSIRAVDYLQTRDDVDGERIGALGMSMGSTMAWWTAALDERVRVCVDICCLTDFQALIDADGLDGHGIYYYVPRLLNHFTAAEINALISPRPHLGLAGNQDSLTPPDGLGRIDGELRGVYAHHGVPERWRLHREDVGHEETSEMRRLALEFLDRWL